MTSKNSIPFLFFILFASSLLNPNFASSEFQTADTLTWVTLQSANPPEARTNHSLAVLPNGQILLFGGQNSNNNVLGDTWLFTPPQGTNSTRNNRAHKKNSVEKLNEVLADWSPLTTPDSPSGRQGHSMVTLPDGRVLLYGGSDDLGAWFNDLHAFAADQWSTINPSGASPAERANHRAWVGGGNMYIYGGFGPSLYEDFWRYNTTTNLWEQLESPPDLISPHAFPMINSNLVSFIDVHRFPYNNGKLLSYDMELNNWIEQQLTNWPPVPRSFYKMVQNNVKAYMLGGATWDEINQKNVYSDEVWSFDYSSLSWTQSTPMPYTVYDGDAVFDPEIESIIVWGGRISDEALFPAGSTISGYFGSPPVGISTFDDIPTEFKLEQNFPNPFNPTTKISFSIPQRSQIKLKVFDVLGREVVNLAGGVYEVGNYEVTFDASKLSSGVYFYNLTTGINSISKKMLLVK